MSCTQSGAGHSSAGRDRDPAGRPRNSRPRDAAGRPLDRGAPGVERVPEDLVLPPAQALAEAQRLLDAGLAFSAHEVLEGAWKAAPPGERDLWQGLAQLAVGVTHVQRGNPVGAVALLRRAGERISPYAESPPHDVDVPGLLRWSGALANRIAGEGLPASPPQPPRLTRG